MDNSPADSTASTTSTTSVSLRVSADRRLSASRARVTAGAEDCERHDRVADEVVRRPAPDLAWGLQARRPEDAADQMQADPLAEKLVTGDLADREHGRAVGPEPEHLPPRYRRRRPGWQRA